MSVFSSSLLMLTFVSDFLGECFYRNCFSYLCLAVTIFHNYLNKSSNALPAYVKTFFAVIVC